MSNAEPSAPPIPVYQETASSPPPPTTTREISEEQIAQLKEQGFTRGLVKSLYDNNIAFPLRIWVVDNSGSMQKSDGHRFVETKKHTDVRMIACSRWEEITECVNYHAQLSALLQSPTAFRLLNNPGAIVGPQQFGIAQSDPSLIPKELSKAMTIMRKARPTGTTPLTQHIREIYEHVFAMAPQLNAEGKRVAVILATDGLPTDFSGIHNTFVRDEFISALKMLEGLPIWLVIRLSTDDEPVEHFYNQLDGQLEMSVEVLDDFKNEAKEVYKCNPWLTYGLPLHRLRELCFHDRIFDLIDERPLTKTELRDFLFLLFGDDQFDGIPDPSVDWPEFRSSIQRLLDAESKQWNSTKSRMTPWIDMYELDRMYGDGPNCHIL